MEFLGSLQPYISRRVRSKIAESLKPRTLTREFFEDALVQTTEKALANRHYGNAFKLLELMSKVLASPARSDQAGVKPRPQAGGIQILRNEPNNSRVSNVPVEIPVQGSVPSVDQTESKIGEDEHKGAAGTPVTKHSLHQEKEKKPLESEQEMRRKVDEMRERALLQYPSRGCASRDLKVKG